MKCTHCNEEIPDGSIFCEACGEKLVETLLPNYSCECPTGQSKPNEFGYCKVCGIYCLQPANTHVEISLNSNLAAVSDIGLCHESNQDSGDVAISKYGNIILVVADGVSSSINPEIASETAVKTVVEVLSDYDGNGDHVAVMKGAIQTA